MIGMSASENERKVLEEAQSYLSKQILDASHRISDL
jgi:hypothetical protein